MTQGAGAAGVAPSGARRPREGAHGDQRDAQGAHPGGWEPRWRQAHARLTVLADEYAALLAAQDPAAAAATGLPGGAVLERVGPEALQERGDAERRLRARVREVDAVGAWDRAPVRSRILRDHLEERLSTSIDMIDSGQAGAHLGGLASPFQRLVRLALRTPGPAAPPLAGAAVSEDGDAGTEGAVDRHAQWREAVARLAALPQALSDLTACLSHWADRGVVAARSQVLLVASRADDLAGRALAGGRGPGALAGLVGRDDVPDALRADLDRAAERAGAAAVELARYLRHELAPRAGGREGVGPDGHELWMRRMLGTRVDPADTFAWAAEQLRGVVAAQDDLAAQVLGERAAGGRPGGGAAALEAHLRSDRGRALTPEQYLEWAQGVADEAWQVLVGPVIGVPAHLGRPQVRLDAPGGGVHYEEPDPRSGRPGRMLRSLAPGEEVLWPWAERTTVLHESVPGHHAHSGAQSVDDRLTVWQRHLARVPGCNEGWALYAEALSVDEGLMSAPPDLYGWLAARRWRLARVLIDLGVHAWLPVPDDIAALPGASGRRQWDRATVTAVLGAHTALAEGFVAFEADKQLGWPAQGLSYVVGEKVWLAGRRAAERRAAAAGRVCDVREFHDRGIGYGSVGLDLLERELV